MIFLGILVSILALAPNAVANELDDIKASGIIVVGTDATYPPFAYADESTRDIVGFDIDLM